MEIAHIFDTLLSTPVDNLTGIKITRMTGDDECCLYAAEIAPQTRVRPHYHRHGIEIYQILSGDGMIAIGVPAGDNVTWTEEYQVRSGDCFTVPENHVHQLTNTGADPLLAVFITPTRHLAEDRYFVDGA